MTEPLAYVRTFVGGIETRKGRNVPNPAPEPPGTLTGTAGDQQVSLSWGASATPGVTYTVKRVNNDIVVATTAGTSATITGLTNGITYNFQVYATNSNGTSAPSNKFTAQPQSGGSTAPDTYFGMNVATNTAKGDGFTQSLLGRKAMFSNRVPLRRVYGATLVATFDQDTTTCPEKRCCYSYKAGGKWSEAQLANGAAVADMVKWLESIPAGWIVFWVYHHEPNSPTAPGGLEVDPTNFVNTYKYMMQAFNSATLQAGTQVYITVNFMDYKTAPGTTFGQKTATWDDAWVPPIGTHAHLLTFDGYANPGSPGTSQTATNKYGGPATGNRYDNTYPLPSVRYKTMFQIIERCGYKDAWGILEVNAPLRNFDTTESGRALWFQDTLDLFLSPPMTNSTPPKILLLWEGASGANWDQAFGSNISSASPGGTCEPFPQRTDQSVHPNAGDSPCWDVWRPYMTAMPLTG